jgi:hypothetical protein
VQRTWCRGTAGASTGEWGVNGVMWTGPYLGAAVTFCNMEGMLGNSIKPFTSLEYPNGWLTWGRWVCVGSCVPLWGEGFVLLLCALGPMVNVKWYLLSQINLQCQPESPFPSLKHPELSSLDSCFPWIFSEARVMSLGSSVQDEVATLPLCQSLTSR